MILLFFGVALWVSAHFFKRLAPERRAAMGDKGKGIIAGLVFGSIVLMIVGYKMADFLPIWQPAGFFTHINNLMMVFALYFTSPGPMRGAIFYKMRHPMLTGFGIWAAAHLLVNGDAASLLLFGSLLVWAILQARIINRAEPTWTQNPKGSFAKDGIFLVASIVLLGVIGFIHGLIGPSPFPV